ncbi:MAG: DUF5658 family protein [Planctomycetota bacterium]|nr:DUF5658 family protein [Planctomycetota bacterium]
MSPLSCLRFYGRRRLFRRDSEDLNSYVDCPLTGTMVLVFLVLISSIVDAYLTLDHLAAGALEANPFMSLALDSSTEFFVALKMGLTACGVVFLAVHQLFPLGRMSLRVVTIAYGALVLYHLVLLTALH